MDANAHIRIASREVCRLQRRRAATSFRLDCKLPSAKSVSEVADAEDAGQVQETYLKVQLRGYQGLKFQQR